MPQNGRSCPKTAPHAERRLVIEIRAARDNGAARPIAEACAGLVRRWALNA